MNHEDEDLYGGYDEPTAAGAPRTAPFQILGPTTPGTPMSGSKTPGTPGGARGGTPSTSDGLVRPMTSSRGAGFSSTPRSKFDPLGGPGRSPLAPGGPSSLMPKKGEVTPQETARDMERRVHTLLEESAAAHASGDVKQALEKALEARKRERSLSKFRESKAVPDYGGPELAFAVELQVAAMHAANRLWQEALDGYTALVKNRQLPQAASLRVNVGNVYFAQGRYPPAIKAYRIALDTLPPAAGPQRARLLRNIGLAFARMGQYTDAATAFETALAAHPEHQAAYHLLLCCYALGDVEGMRAAFQRLASCDELPPESDSSEDEDEEDLEGLGGGEGRGAALLGIVQDVGGVGSGRTVPSGDRLKEDEKQRRVLVQERVLTAAQLLAERVDGGALSAPGTSLGASPQRRGTAGAGGLTATSGGPAGAVSSGFDWCAEVLRGTGHPLLAAEVLLAKAGRFLAGRNVAAATSVFKEFENKESALRARAATNLSFLHLLEGDLDAAAGYTDLALKTDRYNAKAHVNRGVLLMEGGRLEEARQAFRDAAAIEPLLPQALYNLGVVELRLQEPQAALVPLRKLHGLLPDLPEAVHCIALAHDMAGDAAGAVRWLEMLTSLAPGDPGVLCKLGAIHYRLGDEARSLGYYRDAHRVWPVNLDVISWLGAYHVRTEVYEKAIPYFELAAAVQPSEVKWALMVASCHRRVGALDKALAKYESIAAAHPGNVECLRYLVRLCGEMGRNADAESYSEALRRAERAAEAAAAADMAAATSGGPQLDNPAAEHSVGPTVGRQTAAWQQLGRGSEDVQGHGTAQVTGPHSGGQAGGGEDGWDDAPLGEDLLPL